MFVKSAQFRNFRNLENETAEFCEGVNVLRGENAQGKSNILEGIYLFARGRSFRSAHDREMIRFDTDGAGLTLTYLPDGAKKDVRLDINIPTNAKKEFFRGGAKLSGAREMMGNFRAVLFCPAHLSIAVGAPAVRRTWLDIALSQLYPTYLADLSRYQKVLMQRNALLKEAAGGRQVGDAEWESYALVLAGYGARICAARFSYVKRAELSVADFFSDMTSDTERPKLEYNSGYLRGDAHDIIVGASNLGGDCDFSKAAEILAPLYTENTDREIRAGTTLYGIHKDDVEVTLNGRDARSYASQGQGRSLALSMKLSEGEISRSVTGEDPVFLLDDVLSELDFTRRRYILSSLSAKQTIITSCDADLFSDITGARIINVKNGKTSL